MHGKEAEDRYKMAALVRNTPALQPVSQCAHVSVYIRVWLQHRNGRLLCCVRHLRQSENPVHVYTSPTEQHLRAEKVQIV